MDSTYAEAMRQARGDGQEGEAEAESLVAEVSESEPVTPAIEFRNVRFSFEDKKVLEDISFTVAKGEIKIIDSESGFTLARGGEHALWLVPVLMLTVIVLSFGGIWKERSKTFALVSMVSGLVSAYLMNRERVDAEQASGIIGAHVTGWFWLGLFSSLGVAASALIFYLKRSRSP